MHLQKSNKVQECSSNTITHNGSLRINMQPHPPIPITPLVDSISTLCGKCVLIAPGVAPRLEHSLAAIEALRLEPLDGVGVGHQVHQVAKAGAQRGNRGGREEDNSKVSSRTSQGGHASCTGSEHGCIRSGASSPLPASLALESLTHPPSAPLRRHLIRHLTRNDPPFDKQADQLKHLSEQLKHAYSPTTAAY